MASIWLPARTAVLQLPCRIKSLIIKGKYYTATRIVACRLISGWLLTDLSPAVATVSTPD
jgi:hypothetical protein